MKTLFMDRGYIPLAIYVCFGLALLTPFLSVDLWGYAVAFLVAQFFIAFGVALGNHRYFCHRQFKTTPFWEWVMGLTAVISLHGPPAMWRMSHMAHHKHADSEEDPLYLPAMVKWRIPHDIYGIHAAKGMTRAYLKRILKDPVMRFTLKYHWLPIVLYTSLLALFSWQAVLVGWVLPVAITHTLSYAVALINHNPRFGYRNFDTPDKSRNIPWLSWLTWGEAMHHNHHYRAGASNLAMKTNEFDLGYQLIKLIQIAK